MNVNLMHKEILLVRTDFSSGQFCGTKDRVNYNHHPVEKQKLVVAWDSLLLYIFPEILEQQSITKKLYLCKMSERLLFLELKVGEIYLEREKRSSIDPDLFMAMQIFS
jgi:hypothetical protein